MFQFSLRTLMLVTLAAALLLVPVAWVSRQRQQMLLARDALLVARETALRSVVLEGQRRRKAAAGLQAEAPGPKDAPALEQGSSAMEQLRRENAGLRQQVDQLRREVEQLRSSVKAPSEPRP